MSHDPWLIFHELKTTNKTNNDHFFAKRLHGRACDYLAKGLYDEPIFLLKSSDCRTKRPPINLRHLRVDHNTGCKILDGDNIIEDKFVLIGCSSDNPQFYELFVRSTVALINTLPELPTFSQIETCIRTLIELYRKISQQNPKPIKGLWAELFIIDSSAIGEKLLEVWHINPMEKFDFSRNLVHLEIKATEELRRIHDFSLEQLELDGKSQVYIASILLRKSSNGIGILALATRIASKLTDRPDLIVKLWNNIALSLGEDFSEESDITFDETYALYNLRMISGTSIPRVATPLPPGMFDVRFKVDLSSLAESQSLARTSIETYFM